MTDSPINVLIAEDNRLQGRVLQDQLKKAGFEVRWAEDGAVALQMAREHRPDLIVSDIEMPAMTGHEFCRAAKSDDQLRSIPFILLSTLAEPEDIFRGLDCGADNYVTKPYRMPYLIQRMESLLQTPVDASDEDVLELEVTLAGESYRVRSGRQQVLNLLVSTFENAVEKNHELLRNNEELSIAKEELAKWNRRLENINARMTRDLEAAAKIQHSLLPTETPNSDALKFAWQYIPCDELAGDFLNVFPLDPDHIAMFVVDVSGHGVPSSLLSVTIGRVMTPDVAQNTLLASRGEDGETVITPPAEVARELNRRFPMEDQGNLYFTMVYGVLHVPTLRFRYVSAGHNPIVHRRAGQAPTLCAAEGFAIGWMEDSEYDEHEIQLQAGDRLLLYSDGIPEALDERLEEFDEPRLLQLVEKCDPLSLDDLIQTVCGAVKHWCRVNGPKDDVSILGLEIRPEA
ncbi:MAG: fused response regulator/phosphatase [Planctomycetota bacterium]